MPELTREEFNALRSTQAAGAAAARSPGALTREQFDRISQADTVTRQAGPSAGAPQQDETIQGPGSFQIGDDRVRQFQPQGAPTVEQDVAQLRQSGQAAPINVTPEEQGLLTDARFRRASPLNPSRIDPTQRKTQEEGASESKRALQIAGRIGLEGAAGIASFALSGGATGAPLAARMASLALAEGTAALAAESFDPTENPLLTAGIAAGTAGLAEGGAGVLSRVVRGGTALEEGGEELVRRSLRDRERLIRVNLDAGEVIPPGRVSKSRIIDTIENISNFSLFGGGRLERGRAGVEALIQSDLDEFVTKFRGVGSREAVGELIVDSLERGAEGFKGAANQMARKLDVLKSGVTVNISDGVAVANDLLGQVGSRAKPKSQLLAQTLLDQTGNGPLVSFETAQKLRSVFLAVGRTGDELISGEGQAAAARLSQSLDGSMDQAARVAGGTLRRNWRVFNRFWKEGAEVFNSKLIKSLANAEPEVVLDKAIRGKRPGTIRQVRKVILSPPADLKGPARLAAIEKGKQGWQEIQGEWLVSILKESEVKGVAKLSSALGDVNAANAAGRLHAFRPAAAKEVIGSEGFGQLTKLLRSLEITQAKNVGKSIPGAIFIQLRQTGATAELVSVGLGATTGFGGEEAVILFGPRVAAQLFTSPRFVKWATIGIEAPPGSELALRAFAQMSAIAGRQIALQRKNTNQSKRAARSQGGLGGFAGDIGSRGPRPVLERKQEGKTRPTGNGLYDFDEALNAGLGPDNTGHWPSRIPNGPREGLILKLPGHQTLDKTFEAERRLGNTVVFRNGRYWSFEKGDPRAKAPQPTRPSLLQ